VRTLFMGSRDISDHSVSYYLLADECGELGENYGVAIEDREGETSHVAGITPSQCRILGLVSALMKYAVTPATLRDVIEDWILE